MLKVWFKKVSYLVLFLCVIFSVNADAQSIEELPTFGVSLCGPEFGQEKIPGVINVDYVYPRAEDINYFANKGVKLVQLPFRWERVQKELGGKLDLEELKRMKEVVNHCEFRGIKVILNMHNFGRYRLNTEDLILGSPKLPINYLKDFWKRMAAHFKEYKNIYAYDIMNEPHDLGQNEWFRAAQEAIYGIRDVDTEKTIMIEGDHYANANVWDIHSDNLNFLRDPANNLIFKAHCYFDGDVSGRYQRSYGYELATENTGVEKVKPFINWLKKNNLRGFVGEFGVPKTDHRWLKTLDKFLDYLVENNVSGAYWAAGPWWKNYPLSIQPVHNNDQPQMMVFGKYIGEQLMIQVAAKRQKPILPETISVVSAE